MVTNENELESHIVGDENFCRFIEKIHNLRDVSFAGRQAHIGTENILDLVYEGKENIPDEVALKVIIIVELKFRALEPKDFAQLGRYISALLDYGDEAETLYVKGLLVGTGVTKDVACMLNADMLSEDIKVCNISSQLQYHDSACGWWTGAVNTNGAVDICIQHLLNGESNDERTA